MKKVSYLVEAEQNRDEANGRVDHIGDQKGHEEAEIALPDA